MLEYDFKRLIRSKGLYISIIVGLLLILQEGINSDLLILIKNKVCGINADIYKNVTFFGMSVFFSSFVLFIPLLSTLPFSGSFYNDFSNRMYTFILPKTSTEKYIKSKITTTFIGGFVSIFIPLFLYGIICIIFAMPIDINNPEHYSELSGSVYQFTLHYGGFLYIIMQSFFIALYGALCALLGLMVSTFWINKFTCYLFPVVIIYLTNFILAKTSLSWLSPYQSFDIRLKFFIKNPLFGILYQLFYLAVFTVIISIIIQYKIKRRLVI